MHYGPRSYYRLGRVFPRNRLRQPWQQRLPEQPFSWPLIDGADGDGDALGGEIGLRATLAGETRINDTVQPRVIYIGEDNDVCWSGMVTASDNVAVTDAVVAMTLVDDAGNIVSGASGLPLVYDVDTPSDYLGVLPSTIELDEAARYYLEITATRGPDQGFRRIPIVATYDER